MVPTTLFNRLEGEHKVLKSLVDEKSKLLDKVYSELKAVQNKVRNGGGREGGNGGGGGDGNSGEN